MTTATYMTVANEIKRQLGGRAAMMIGATNFCGSQTEAGDPALSFKVGRNAKRVTHIRITLQQSDTYRMEFLAVRGGNVATLADVRDVYVDQLHEMITLHTGLYTSL